MDRVIPPIALGLFLFVLFLPFSSWSQAPFGIMQPENNAPGYAQTCARLTNIMEYKAKEISFGLRQDDDYNLYFQFNDKEWFLSLFETPYDGLAVDIVTKSQFECDEAPITTQLKGELLRPVYRNQLKKGIKAHTNGFHRVWLGKVPLQYAKKEVEYNIVFLQQRTICRYQVTYNLQSYNYSLLDMGLYLDTITYNEDGAGRDFTDSFKKRFKKLEFQIPFEKNKGSFAPADIKPLYDSLKLTDFDIKKIAIKAYSSIEGSTEKNAQLQQERSESIIKALQSFQKPSIEKQVSVAENWVEFLEDIEETEYHHLKELSKTQIKSMVTGSVALKLEKYLTRHRKGIVTLFLEKKSPYRTLAEGELVEAFNEAIQQEQMDKAFLLQQTLFQRLRDEEVNPEVLTHLVIPKQKKFVDFFNASSAFRYEMDRSNLLAVYYEFQELNKWVPNNKKIAYNLLALKLRVHHAFGSMPETTLLSRISKLTEHGISKGLIDRMKVNYHIILCERLMEEGKYEEKDAAVTFILDAYKNVALRDLDYLSLAQFVTYYYDNQTAIDLIADEVQRIDVDKRLLFYYLNLTMVRDAIVASPEYRKIMLNAVNLDKKRFCASFAPPSRGGVTFQLLDNPFLKKAYCENCKD